MNAVRKPAFQGAVLGFLRTAFNFFAGLPAFDIFHLFPDAPFTARYSILSLLDSSGIHFWLGVGAEKGAV